MSNCILSANEAGVRGGGISYTGDHPLYIDNCTIVGNRAGDSGGGIGLGGGSGEAVIRNTILWDNRAPQGDQIVCDGKACTSIMGCVAMTIQYCCIEPGQNSLYDTRGDLLPGVFSPIQGVFQHNGNILDDPLFASLVRGAQGSNDVQGGADHPCEPGGNYYLKSQAGRWDPNSGSWVQDDVTSPCVDAGDPNDPIGNEPFPNGGRINIGAYGGTAEASKSYFDEPVSKTIIAGDINGDGKVDWLDLDILARNWLRDVRK